MSNKKSHRKARYRALIIGAGRIASGFDSPKNRAILTHAHAYRRSPSVDIAGFFDVNSKAAARAARRWGGKAIATWSALTRLKPDIVSVCTPDATHYEILRRVLTLNPRIVIAEKPLTDSVSKTEKILRLYERKKIPILVNYTYLFDTAVQDVRRAIDRGSYGKILGASARYTKGVLHNGSHAISLARYLFGEARSVQANYAIADYDAKDRTVAGFLTFARCPQFHLMAGDERKYSVFEFDIFFEKKRLTIADLGFALYAQRAVADTRFTGYKSLGERVPGATYLDQAMSRVVANAVDHLRNKKKLLCDMHDAYRIQKICSALFEQSRSQ